MPVYRSACSSVAGASLTVFMRTQFLTGGNEIFSSRVPLPEKIGGSMHCATSFRARASKCSPENNGHPPAELPLESSGTKQKRTQCSELLAAVVNLPSPEDLIRRCRALAALDLILSPEWDHRYYSFDSRWPDEEMMGSMRNGCGDDWFLLFNSQQWAGLKGLGHESAAWSTHGTALSRALKATIPAEFAAFADEPAFSWDETSFAYFHCPNGGWSRSNDLADFGASTDTGEVELLQHLVGTPNDYARFAADYFEAEVEEQLVARIFNLEPVTPTLVAQVCPSTNLEQIAEELYGVIGYPEP
jgi:hypothetical protein